VDNKRVRRIHADSTLTAWLRRSLNRR
jgi:hypothetical protein